MLPILHLDDEMYEEILEDAKNKIPLYYPEWTDYNEHDPGITFLELFSWLKEAQQFYMDHIDKSMLSKFLQLLGIQLRHNTPASGWLMLKSSAAAKILSGTPFYAEKLCLVLKETVWSSGAVISSMKSADGINCSLQEILSNSFRFYPFGKNPEKNDVWEITFEKVISYVKRLTLFIYVFDEYTVKRNSVLEGYMHMAQLQAEVEVNEQWYPCKIISDKTAALTVSGQICLELPDKENISKLRFRISETTAYDVPPLITGIKTDVFEVMQLEPKSVCVRISAKDKYPEKFNIPLTYSSANWQAEYLIKDETGYLPVIPDEVRKTDEYICVTLNSEHNAKELLAVYSYENYKQFLHIGNGDGFPYQEFDINCENLHYDSFELIIYDIYNKHWHLWKKTDSLLSANHLDRVYKLDEKNGKLIFGNGEHGRMPDGELWIISAAFTLGAEGNLKSGEISDGAVLESIWKNSSYRDLVGGAAAETPLECRMRGQYENRIPSRAVTREDYLKLVYAAPGLMVHSCHVSDGGAEQNCVNIAIEPYTGTEKAKPNPVYLNVLKQFLEPRRLIGTELNISFPQYADIYLYLVVNVHVCDLAGEERIRRKLENLFQVKYHEFGKKILYSEVYAAIDLMPEVRQIQTLVMQCRSDSVKISRSGDLFLPENGLPYLSKIELKLITAI